MPVLANQRHELFAQGIAQGKTQGEAYKDAGYKPSDPGACRLARIVKIAARIDELKQRAANKCELTIADLVAELEEARAIALQAETPQSSAAVTATMGKAKLLGLVTDKALVDQRTEVTVVERRVID